MTKKHSKNDDSAVNMDEFHKLQADLDHAINEKNSALTQLAKMEDLAKRSMADLQNYKRIAEEEKSQLIVFANMRLLSAIFPALDNFDRAFTSMPQDLQENEWAKGIKAIEASLMSAMQSLGLETINQINIAFDPHQHEVLLEGEGEKNQVVQVFEKGYSFKGKVVRPAKVMVGKG